MRLQVFHLKKNILTSDKTVVKRLLEIVVYNVVKWKVEILLAFFLVFILFNFVTIGNEVFTNQTFLKRV